MKKQLKCFILVCLTLAFSGCESLPQPRKAGEQQKSFWQSTAFQQFPHFFYLSTILKPEAQPRGAFLPNLVENHALFQEKISGEKILCTGNMIRRAGKNQVKYGGILTVLLETLKFSFTKDIKTFAEGFSPVTA
jgi:hypothetical protein